VRCLLTVAIAVVLLPSVLEAQGVTSAAIYGVVSTEDGSPVPHAIVRLTNTSTGQPWERPVGLAGRYLFEDVVVGGPYRIEVRALGFRPEAIDGITLALGSRTRADFTLYVAAAELPAVIALGARTVFAASRSGPAGVISANMISNFPNIGRDFLRLTTWSAFAANSPASGGAPTGGITIAGQNRALNGFLIDGAGNLDQYTGRLPGRETLPRPISIEALQEIQVLSAPFDVRHGGFTGGLVNAVTRSGTNHIQGSVFAFLADGAFVGANDKGERVQPFTTKQYGATIGGPIARDRAHFFVALDLQDRVVPDPGPLIGDTVGGADTARIRISYASARRFQDILQRTYGLDPGTLGPEHGVIPASDAFAKIDWQLGLNHRLEISQRYAHGNRDGFIARGAPGQYFLSSAGRRDPSTSSASRVIWTGIIGQRWSNELIASHLSLRDACQPHANYPFLNVGVRDVPSVGGRLFAGTPIVCPSAFSQRTFELTDNLTVDLGAHAFTVGTQIGLLHFTDNLLQGSAGLWQFENLDSLHVGSAARYDRTLAGPGRTNGVRFGARQVALYAQDRWNPTSRLTLTAGLRADATFLTGRVPTNTALLASLGADTRRVPSGTVSWSPRASFTLDAAGDGSTVVRGGTGLFSGRPPYVWLASAYRDDGTQELFLTCSGRDVPRFDPLNQPASCVSGAVGKPRLTFFDPELRLPQSVKAAVGLDHRLPGRVHATLDVLYNRSLHDFYVSDANLEHPIAVATGEGNRPLYGTISANGRATPERRDSTLGQVVRFSNSQGDEAITATVQLRRQIRDAELGLWYTYTRSRDRMSLVNFPARANLENPPLDGSLEERRRGTSYFEVPHGLMIHAMTPLPYGVRLSLMYTGSSGAPFTYVITGGDANADGIGAGLINNDIVYVPRDSSDIALENAATWPLLNAFIESQACLRAHRGRILARNSCRNPATHILNGRVTKRFQVASSQALELRADVYNVLSLFNRQWGRMRTTSTNPAQPMLQLRAWDPVRQRGVYSLLADPRRVQDLASRWQLEFSVRYLFSAASR
jgi:hypothetical protein